ncbi:hypothetical protein TSIB_1432 [Thermococcus sibiricus MM 739]|uniref:Uncharacterized protein n=1 Tax=Thermococcus sibiricus (strain DSM 12597 / MM 739) TaxID=604354 RepID=C6A4D8_THESM|nr:hypothetical protein TSIB_1432 [Thermococcus sibiricus MM 739]
MISLFFNHFMVLVETILQNLEGLGIGLEYRGRFNLQTRLE